MRQAKHRAKHGRLSALVSMIALLGTLLLPLAARADEARLRFLAEKIKDPDVRVRTSAALALGATGEDGAVEPLCTGLSDSEELVRQASVAAIKRLNKVRAVDCLRARDEVESSEAVKSAIARTIEALTAGGEGIAENPNAKYYVSLSPISNQTGRAQAEIERIVLVALRQKLDGVGTVQWAPASETSERAREVMKTRKLKGFYLSIAVDKFEYVDGNLRVKIKVGVCNYPQKSLLGTFDKSLTAQGVTSGDKASEDRLLELAAGLAGEKFAQNVSAFL
jgi:hypothetical protein